MPARAEDALQRVRDGIAPPAYQGAPPVVLPFARGGHAAQEQADGEERGPYRNPAQRAVMLKLMGLREPSRLRPHPRRDAQLELPFDDPSGPRAG